MGASLSKLVCLSHEHALFNNYDCAVRIHERIVVYSKMDDLCWWWKRSDGFHNRNHQTDERNFNKSVQSDLSIVKYSKSFDQFHLQHFGCERGFRPRVCLCLFLGWCLESLHEKSKLLFSSPLSLGVFQTSISEKCVEFPKDLSQITSGVRERRFRKLKRPCSRGTTTYNTVISTRVKVKVSISQFSIHSRKHSQKGRGSLHVLLVGTNKISDPQPKWPWGLPLHCSTPLVSGKTTTETLPLVNLGWLPEKRCSSSIQDYVEWSHSNLEAAKWKFKKVWSVQAVRGGTGGENRAEREALLWGCYWFWSPVGLRRPKVKTQGTAEW